MGRTRHLGLVLLVTLLSSLGWAQGYKLAPDLKADDSNELVNVIVQFKHTLGETHRNKIRNKGGVVHADLSLVKSLSGRVPRNRLRELSRDPEVAHISPDRPVRSYLNNATVAVNAPAAWSQGFEGSGIGVAVLDSGVQNVNDLVSQGGNSIVYSASFITGDTSTADAWGHGTHVSGIIGGNGHSSKGLYQGMAANASILNFRVLDANGVGQDSYVISAIQAAIALQATYNIRVINLSLGRPVYESYMVDPLCQAVEQAWRAGIVVVVAAGNDGRDNSAGTNGYATITAPGNDPYVITVGAMKSMGTPTRADDLSLPTAPRVRPRSITS